MVFSFDELQKIRQNLNEEFRKKEVEGVKYDVTVEEDVLFQRFYLRQLSVINSHLLKLPNRVQACASYFFKRFYLKNSITKYHPKHVTLTCLFVASKVEENRLDAAAICRMANKPEWDKEVLKIEVPLLDALEFRLMVDHPHVAAFGWLDELNEREVKTPKKEEIYLRINEMMTTDACLLFNASHIACSCIIDCCEEVEMKEKVKLFFEEKAKENREGFLKMLDEIKVYLDQSKVNVTNNEVVGIEKKIILWNKQQKKASKKNKKEKGPSKKEIEKEEKLKKKEEALRLKNKRLIEGSPSKEMGEFQIITNMKRRKKEEDNK